MSTDSLSFVGAVAASSPLPIRPVVYCVFFAIIIYLYRKWINGRQFNMKLDVSGKVAIVTGSNTGIGKETALGLARYGVHVILACRNMQAAAEARNDIISATGNRNVRCMKLDLASFKSIRTFADEFLATGSPLHILINNAGVMGMDRRTTEDGLEEHIGVNHFGHFLLTLLLLRRLLESKPSRVVNVSSWGHNLVTMHKDDLMGEKNYNRFHAYGQSKLANIYFTRSLAKRLIDTGVNSNALHPGVIFTDLSRNLESFSWILQKWVCDLISTIFLRSTQAGAQTSLSVALDPNIQKINGFYFSNVDFAMPSYSALDDDMAEWLWRKSEEITGVKFEDCVTTELLQKPFTVQFATNSLTFKQH